MMQGPIQRMPLSRTESRADTRLPATWIRIGSAESPQPDGSWRMRPTMHDLKGPVLAMIGRGNGDARAALLTSTSTNSRIYALVGPDWGKDQADNQVLQTRSMLVRRLAEVPSSAIHFGTQAYLWIGARHVLHLERAQAEALRQVFLRLFWHDATEEMWSGNPQFGWRPARERPFDVPDVSVSASVRWEPAAARLTGDPRGALMHVSSGLPPDAAPLRLWFPAGPAHHERLAKLALANVEVVWAERGLPDLLVNGGTSEVLLPGANGRLRLRLTAPQAARVTQLLEATPTWQFKTNVRLGEANHRTAHFWLAGESVARGLELEQCVEAPAVAATSLRAAPTTVPASMPTAQPLALAVRYQWTVVPPRVPTGAEEDALVGRWRKLNEDWTVRLARCRVALVAAEGDRGRIGRAFSRLVSAMLGFERTHGGLLARVSALEAQRPSAAGPSGAHALLTQLGEIEDAARKLQADLEEAERNARDDQEREKQQAAWQSRVDAANRDLPDRRKALTTAESRRVAIADDLRGIDESLESAEREAKKDLTANQRKLSDDLQRANNGVTRLRGEISALEQQAAELFEFRPSPAPAGRPAQPGGRFVPTASTARPTANVPDEALPEVGTLRSHKGKRYLVINNWEQLDVGEHAAERLSALLVAPEDA